jgi:hypothetical protein
MLEQALELDPDSFLAGVFRHCTLHLTGRFQEAATRAQEVLTMSGRHPGVMAFLIATFCDWGKPVSQIRQAIQISDPYRDLVFSKYFPYGERLHANGRCRDLLCKAGFE